MLGDETMFGVNFADGRIKGYGLTSPGPRGEKEFYARYVRGNVYGKNDFKDNGDNTITDESTGLMWMKKDNGHYGVGHSTHGGLNWKEALEYCEELKLAGKSDWRLPNVKELQYIVDYNRSPDTTNSAAIDPIFDVTKITDEGENINYPFYWTGTTHKEGPSPGRNASYVAFGEASGFMEQPHNSGNMQFMDVHGAGAQRSDPKTGDPADYPTGHGPQGDVIRIYNYVRCVRNGATFNTDTEIATIPQTTGTTAPQPPENTSNPPGGGMEPPQEAQDACSGKASGNICSFQAPHGLITGTCLYANNKLACVP